MQKQLGKFLSDGYSQSIEDKIYVSRHSNLSDARAIPHSTLCR